MLCRAYKIETMLTEFRETMHVRSDMYVKNVLKFGPSSLSMVVWTGKLDYRIEVKHDRIVMEYKTDLYGKISVCKSDSTFAGADFHIYFSRDGKDIGKVRLCTYYSGEQPKAQLLCGDELFLSEIATGGSSTCLFLYFKPDLKLVNMSFRYHCIVIYIIIIR